MTDRRNADSTVAGTGEEEARFPVVAIGASAGGLEAVRSLLGALPEAPGMAFVVIQHLAPYHENLTSELLDRHVRMPVRQAEDGELLEPNHCYVIPPNRYMRIKDNRFTLTEPPQSRIVHVTIDVFFRSLAEERGERAVAIVLSGSGTDGALGTREIHAAGGVTLAQQPSSAGFAQMPRAAMDTGVVDLVQTPEEMAAWLREWDWQPVISLPETSEGDETAELDSQGEFEQILSLLRRETGHDFSGYKKKTVGRRLDRRMGMLHLRRLDEYLAYTRENPRELTALYKDLLIGVTGFYREPADFRIVEERVIPDIVARKSDEDSIRVWVPGCASGEEAYTLAMMFDAALEGAPTKPSLKIFATDLNEAATEIGRYGVYPESIAAELPADKLNNYFVRDGTHFRVRDSIREMVIFAKHDLLSDPPFSRLDLVSCRNLLIYFERDVQRRIMGLFHYVIRDGGFLFLGRAEGAHREESGFKPIHKSRPIYRRLRGPVGRRPESSLLAGQRSGTEPGGETAGERRRDSHRRLDDILAQHLLRSFAPPAVLVDECQELLYSHGDLSPYLVIPSGAPSFNIVHAAREGLKSKLRQALIAAANKGEKVVESGIRVKRADDYGRIRVTVRPVPAREITERTFMVVFEEEPEPLEPVAVTEESTAISGDRKDEIIGQLEHELETTNEDHRQTIEELNASNEALMSMNEEFQSTNEELETSKEELQSLNEELQTVNTQLENKVAELESAHADLANLLRCTAIPMLFLDRDLQIRQFTPSIGELINIQPQDEGRKFSDLTRRFDDPALEDDIDAVLRTSEHRENEVVTDEGRVFLRRLSPYWALAEEVEGVVLSFVDVQRLKEAESELQSLAANLEQRVDEQTRLVSLLHAIGRNLRKAQQLARLGSFEVDLVHPDRSTASEQFFRITGIRPSGQPLGPLDFIQNHVQPKDQKRARSAWKAAVDEGKPFDTELRLRGKGGAERTVHLSGEAIRCETGEIVRVLGTMHDITERKQLEQAVTDAAEDVQQRMAQELHDNVSQQLAGVHMLTKSLEDTLRASDAAPAERAARIRQTIEDVQRNLRDVLRGLRPVEVAGHGLMEALNALAERMREQFEIKCRFDCPKPIVVENNYLATQLYYIAQEALANAVRHAQATRIDLQLIEEADALVMRVRDNGVGLESRPEEDAGSGLRIMGYRARQIGGEVAVEDHPEGGVEVLCAVPFVTGGD